MTLKFYGWSIRIIGHILYPMRKKLATVTAHCELKVTKMVTASRDWAVTWAMIELWPSRDWAVIILKMLTASCDLTVIELWPHRDWAVTLLWPSLAVPEPWSLCPGTTVVTVSSWWAHCELTKTIYFLMGCYVKLCAIFQRHRRIQTGVTIWKRSIWSKSGMFCPVWPWNLMEDHKKQ